MGSGIAQVAAQAGHEVYLFDAREGEASRAIENTRAGLRRLKEKGKIDEARMNDILSRMKPAASLDQFAKCAIVIEAIVEDLRVKKDLFGQLEKIVGADCILGSNTSSLSVTAIASSCSLPGRLIGIHFFNPAAVMPLVEIIPGLTTAEDIVAAVKSLITDWGKVPVIASDTPGFIVNRIARPFYGEAIRIYEERWADLPAGDKGMATIDWAMKEIGGFRMGPFELMDLIGNDINYAVTETVWQQTYNDPRYKPSLTQRRMVESGRLGKKTKRGYYDYADGAMMPGPDQDRLRGEKIFMRILSMLINEAADALYYRVASREDIDLAMTKGVNYPHGLLRWCDELGASKILEIMNELYSTYKEERYRPSLMLKKMAEEKAAFYI